MNAERYGIWEVKNAASGLVSQAQSIGARYLRDSMQRSRFNREVAWYATRVIGDVESGRVSPEHGMQVLKQEQRSLLQQSWEVGGGYSGLLPKSPIPRPGPIISRATAGPDPKRLMRFFGAQQREHASGQPAVKSLGAKTRPMPVDTTPLFPPEQWPAAVELYDPGFYIVPSSTTSEQLEAQLFTSPKPAVIAKFRALNPGLDQVKAGQMIVLSDPDNGRCTEVEARLMTAAIQVNEALADLDPEEANFLVRHRDEIETFLTRGSTSIGIGEAIFANHMKSVESLLLQLEALHVNNYQKHGHLHAAEFFAERKRLLDQLNSVLTSMTKKGIGFPDHPKLKTALGISSRSLIHRWGRAGAPGMNPGYATHLRNVARASKYLKYGGYIGIAIGGGASVMKVQDVCAAGDVEACEKVKYTEAGSFTGTVAGGVLVGAASAATTAAVCAALGVPTLGLGALACGIVVVGAGAAVVGTFGGEVGGLIGDFIYGTYQ